MPTEVPELSQALQVSPAELGLLDGLDAKRLAHLAAAVTHRIRTDLEEVEESIEHAIRVVPRPLRGRARRILLPGQRRD